MSNQPPLSNERFEKLLQLVQPPVCRYENAILASEKFSLTGCQRATLILAVWESFWWYLNAKERKAKENQQSFLQATSEYGWGHIGRTFGKEVNQ